MAGTWTKKRANCDVCSSNRLVRVARFDAKTAAGPWGNLCYEHWRIYCYPKLGVGIGQLLVRGDEDPRRVAAEINIDRLPCLEEIA